MILPQEDVVTHPLEGHPILNRVTENLFFKELL